MVKSVGICIVIVWVKRILIKLLPFIKYLQIKKKAMYDSSFYECKKKWAEIVFIYYSNHIAFTSGKQVLINYKRCNRGSNTWYSILHKLFFFTNKWIVFFLFVIGKQREKPNRSHCSETLFNNVSIDSKELKNLLKLIKRRITNYILSTTTRSFRISPTKRCENTIVKTCVFYVWTWFNNTLYPLYITKAIHTVKYPLQFNKLSRCGYKNGDKCES